MQLSNGWTELIEDAKRQAAHAAIIAAPKQPVSSLAADHFQSKVTFINSREHAETMLQLVRQRAISHVGIRFSYFYSRPGVPINEHDIAYDPRSIRPTLLALTFVEHSGNTGTYRFVVDVRNPEVLPALKELLKEPIRFVGHEMKSDLFCLWKLRLGDVDMLWDARVAEGIQDLGRLHPRYARDKTDNGQAAQECEYEERFRLSLRGTCQHHGIRYMREQASLERQPVEHSAADIDGVVEDATAIASLYFAQVIDATIKGSLHHLETIAMDWTRTVARAEWRGVKPAVLLCERVREACEARLRELESQLIVFGIENFRSHDCLMEFFAKHGLLELFINDGEYGFDRKQLGLYIDRHEAMPLLYAARHIADIQRTGILNAQLIGGDGRLHALMELLGTESLRLTTKWPNILGISRIMRPLIIPETGYGIIEIDLSQIEVCIAAVVYWDIKLIHLCNSGDVYNGMAKLHYNDIPEADRHLSDKKFKKKHGPKRDCMKILTLGIIYGLTAFGISNLLNISKHEAQTLLEKFMAMFPSLRQRRDDVAAHAALRGYACTVSGIRRHRAAMGPLSDWELNWMRNHPIQGSAADPFKVACNRLDRLLRRFHAGLIVLFHDAVVIEAPLSHLQAVADLASQELCRAVQEMFPVLRPRVDVNIRRPESWNKDGDPNSVTDWLADPVKSALKKFEKMEE